jgi:hypothetical protein
MRIFLSYASEQHDLARRLALALRSMRNRVFFDRDALPPGGAFDIRIRESILRCHAFIFLASRNSLQIGAYPLSELGIAERRWPHPAGKVLPVLVDDTPVESLPAYLRAVSVLEPKGDMVAEVLDAVAGLKKQRLKLLALQGAAVGIVIALGSSALFWLLPKEKTLLSDGSNVPPTKNSSKAGPLGSDGSLNPRVYTLKNKSQVRLVGGVVKNGSNVHDVIVREGVEHNAWRYNRCYDGSFGHLNAGMPKGTVVITFEIFDQLPSQARIDRSDFADDGFNQCVLGILRGQTLNAASSQGTGPVSYEFKFLPQ